MKAEHFLKLLEAKKFDFFTGVPCSYLSAFCRALAQRDPSIHVPAPREDIALGLASGAYMAGKNPVVYMQNSGLGYSLEVFASLNLIYRIPLFVLLTYRGPEDVGWDEHMVMGEYTEDLLQMFNMPFSHLTDRFGEDDIERVQNALSENERPFFLLVGKEALK